MNYKLIVRITSETEIVERSYYFDTSLEMAVFERGVRAARNEDCKILEVLETGKENLPKLS